MLTNNTYYLQDVWSKAINLIRESGKIQESVINTFFQDANLADLTETKATLVVPMFVNKSILLGEVDLITSSLESVLETQNTLTLEILTEAEHQDRSLADTIKIPKLDIFDGQPLRENMTFDNFVVGNSNKESHSAALACAINPGKYFNPLFIYGNSGLGKTHLLQAIGNYVKKNNPQAVIYYSDTNKFVETVYKSIRDGQIDAFKKYMYSVDVLLMDDIQFLAGKDKSHEIFFSIYNELVNNRKQICIVSDRLPTEIQGLEERLISRFSSGLSVSIDSPEFETSLAILKLKVKTSLVQTGIEEDALAYIASRFNHDVRSLEGALNRVIFYAIEFQKDGNKITLETTANALKNQVAGGEKTQINSKKIIRCVSDYYGLTKQQIVSKSRTKHIATARQISMYLCRKILDMPYEKIGDEFGNRDHSTVMSSCDKIEKQLKENTVMAQAITEIEKLINY